MSALFPTDSLRRLEAAALSGLPPDTLMTRAAEAVAAATARLARTLAPGRPVLALAGPGNNGADALLAAALLRERGYACSAVALRLAPPSSSDAAGAWRRAQAAGLRIEPVSTLVQLEEFCSVIARGYEMLEQHAGAMFPPAVLDDPEVESFLGYCDGIPAATATLVCTGRVAGVHNVATVPEYRKRGFGEALTWDAVATGASYGCDMAALQASEMGQPIYERMGFRVVSPYRTFHLPGV